MDLISQMLVNGQKDLCWFESNLNNLRSRYNNEFIAFQNEEILEHDSSLDNVIDKLKKRNVDTSEIFIKFVSKVKVILLL